MLIYFAANIIEAWQYAYDEPFAAFGIPIFILFARGAALARLRPYSQWFSGWMWFFHLFFIFWINYFIYLKRKELEINT